MMIERRTTIIERLVFTFLILIVCCGFFSVKANAQLLGQNDYGVGVTIALYQYDGTRSKDFSQINKLQITATTPEEEIEFITRTYGTEGLKIRHVRSIGLKEGESFTDTQPINNRPLSFTIKASLVTKGDVTFDFTASYGDKVLLEVKSLAIGSYETAMLRGEQGEFGTREFQGPDGVEEAPENRNLLVTITPSITNTRNLQNRVSDISRATDRYGSKVELSESDIFVTPVLINRIPVRFAPGSRVSGSITLEGIVTPEGRIINVRVLDTPDSALNPKAIEAFREYRFKPAQLNGRPTYATFRETIVLGKKKPL